MTSTPYPLEWSARLVVGSARALAHRRIAVSCIGLVMTILVAGGYIAITALRINPTRSTILVRVYLAQSGGLLPDQEVTLRGIPIGRVRSVSFTETGVVAVAALDADASVPENSVVHVSPLSPAGEQYLDFRPLSDEGASLTDGSVIGESRATAPLPLAQLVADTDGALAQLDPHKLAAITGELRVSNQGPHKLAALLDGGSFLISTLDSVLPQTVSVLRNSRVTLTTLGDTSPGLQHSVENLHAILHGISSVDTGFRALLDRGTAPLTAVDSVIADNSDTIVELLGNLTTIAQLSYVRVPALTALFPTARASVLDAVGSIVHDGGVWGIGDFYPRFSCDYNLPRRPPSQPDFVEPYRYTYCANTDPAVLVRGARNAPRPPGDDTAGPPSGYDPRAQTDPTPLGPNSVPTPYGGPQLPSNPPN